MRKIVLAMCLTSALAIAADWKITLKPRADLKADVPVPVEVTVKDAKGAPVEGAQVELVLTMVEMDHGASKFPATQVRPGVYEAKPKFMMGGKWNVEMRAKKGPESASAKQQVEVED